MGRVPRDRALFMTLLAFGVLALALSYGHLPPEGGNPGVRGGIE